MGYRAYEVEKDRDRSSPPANNSYGIVLTTHCQQFRFETCGRLNSQYVRDDYVSLIRRLISLCPSVIQLDSKHIEDSFVNMIETR